MPLKALPCLIGIRRRTVGRVLPGIMRCRQREKVSRSVSRVLSWTIIHLRQVSPPACSNLPESTVGHSKRIPIWSCSEWGLPSPRLLPAARCALTAPFHPYPEKGVRPLFTQKGSDPFFRRYTFCCTFRRLAPPRRYLAPCPVEPGLSSPQLLTYRHAA